MKTIAMISYMVFWFLAVIEAETDFFHTPPEHKPVYFMGLVICCLIFIAVTMILHKLNNLTKH